MEKIESISTELGNKEINTLLFFYDLSKRVRAIHITWIETHGGIHVQTSNKGKSIDFGNMDFYERESSLVALHKLGFVDYSRLPEDIAGMKMLTLFPAAIDRAVHEKRNIVGKWWENTKLKYKDAMAIIAFVLSVILAGLKIVEYLQGK